MGHVYGKPKGACAKCGEQIGDEYPYSWCIECGEPLPQELRPESARAPRTQTIDEVLAERFVCPRCRGKGGQTKWIATTGTGLSRLMDIQTNEFVAVSCTNCGFTEFYNPEILRGRDNFGAIIDVLFGT